MALGDALIQRAVDLAKRIEYEKSYETYEKAFLIYTTALQRSHKQLEKTKIQIMLEEYKQDAADVQALLKEQQEIGQQKISQHRATKSQSSSVSSTNTTGSITIDSSFVLPTVMKAKNIWLQKSHDTRNTTTAHKLENKRLSLHSNGRRGTSRSSTSSNVARKSIYQDLFETSALSGNVDLHIFGNKRGSTRAKKKQDDDDYNDDEEVAEEEEEEVAEDEVAEDKVAEEIEEKDEINEFERSLMSCIVQEDSNVAWDDVCGLHIAKAQLKEAVVLPMKYPQLFTGKRQPWKGILLYGPPGTGKSYLAKAVATEAESTFFSVSSSDLVSKFQGESEKLIRALFELARSQAPSVVFVDEIDSLCSARTSNESESSKRIKTEFLIQMQGVKKVMDGVLVLGATNDPCSLDPAMRRRFQKRIYISLPDESARVDMFQLHLNDTPNTLMTMDFVRLGTMSKGYSGDDIKNVVCDALMEPLREAIEAEYFVYDTDQDGQQWWFPCSNDHPKAKRTTMNQLPDSEVQCASICVDHFIAAMEKTKPTVGHDELIAYEEWTREFGQEGAHVVDGEEEEEAEEEQQQQQQQQQQSSRHPPALQQQSMSTGIIGYLHQHDATMQQQLQLQQEIVLRLKKQQNDLIVWQERLEKWETSLREREEKTPLVSSSSLFIPSASSPLTSSTSHLTNFSASPSTPLRLPLPTLPTHPPSNTIRRASNIVEAMDPQSTGYIMWEQFLAYVRWQERHFGVRGQDNPALGGGGEGGRERERERGGEKKETSSNRLSPAHRRESMQQRINTTGHQVFARIELRHIFDSLLMNGENINGCVSCHELELAIKFSPKCRTLFMPSLLAKNLSNLLNEDQHQINMTLSYKL